MKKETATARRFRQVFDAAEPGELDDLQRRLRIAPANAGLRFLVARKLAAHSLWDQALSELGVIISADANNLRARKFREEILGRIAPKAS